MFKGKKQTYWNGHKSWLHIWFNIPLIIFGLTYEQDEVFLRWLLIERKRYKDEYFDDMEVCFISLDKPEPSVTNLMLNLGVKIKRIDDYSELYGN